MSISSQYIQKSVLWVTENVQIWNFQQQLFLLSQNLKFFSQFVKSWTSMEHDSNWEPKVGEIFPLFQINSTFIERCNLFCCSNFLPIHSYLKGETHISIFQLNHVFAIGIFLSSNFQFVCRLKHIEEVAVGRQGEPVSCSQRHAVKIFWGERRGIQVLQTFISTSSKRWCAGVI